MPLQYQLGSQADTLVDNNLLYDIKQEVASELSFKGCPLPADRLHSSGYRPREAPGPLIYSDVPTNHDLGFAGLLFGSLYFRRESCAARENYWLSQQRKLLFPPAAKLIHFAKQYLSLHT